MLRSGCFEGGNIKKLKARPPLKELAPNGNIKKLKARPLLKELALNINIFSANLPPKQCRLPKKKNVQQLPYKVILDLDIEPDLFLNRREPPEETNSQWLLKRAFQRSRAWIDMKMAKKNKLICGGPL